MVRQLTIIAATALIAAPLAAYSQSRPGELTYRCVGKDGKKYYGSTVPPACFGQPVEQLNTSGMVVKRIDPEGDEKEREARELEARKRREDEAAAREATRRNRALLATYTSEKDIDEARGRALADNEKAVQDVGLRIETIKKRQASLGKELEFYKGNNKPPARLQDDVRDAEIDLKAQEDLLAAKKKDVDTINAKYDLDKQRYLELTGKDAAGRGRALGMDKGVTVTSKPAAAHDERRNELDAQRRAQQDKYDLQRIDAERENARRRAEYERRR
jgi:hypothetical protein